VVDTGRTHTPGRRFKNGAASVKALIDDSNVTEATSHVYVSFNLGKSILVSILYPGTDLATTLFEDEHTTI
jgi:hypothetical protein